jgi:hypothetical protein
VQLERGAQHTFEVRVAHAERAHVRDRVADVVETAAALADPLRDEPGAAVQVELTGELGMARVGDEGERTQLPRARSND